MCQIVPDYLCHRVAPPEERLTGLGRRDFLKLAGSVGNSSTVRHRPPPSWPPSP